MEDNNENECNQYKTARHNAELSMVTRRTTLKVLNRFAAWILVLIFIIEPTLPFDLLNSENSKAYAQTDKKCRIEITSEKSKIPKKVVQSDISKKMKQQVNWEQLHLKLPERLI
jgi:hypothetical protein